ncbi:MAG: glycine oxidase ThiO [Acidobacteriota bacterium]
MKSDVLIVGGGVIGCSVALRLAQAGLKVTLVERDRIGAEASRAAAGMLSPQAEASEPGAFFDLCRESKLRYRDFVAELKTFSGIDAEYRDEGTLVVALPDDKPGLDEWAAWQIAAGLPIEKLTADDLHRFEPNVTKSATGAIFLTEDHQVENRLLMDALAVAIRRLGVEVIEQSAVQSLLIEAGQVQGVQLEGQKIYSGAVIVAAGSWSGALLEPLGFHIKTIPARGQMLAVRGSAFRHVLHSSRIYLVPRSDNRILIGATVEYAGFEKAITAKSIHALLDGAIELVPAMADAEIIETWSGFRPDTPDHLPIIGQTAIANLWLATGHFRNGILLAPITASLLTQSILNGHTADALKPFSIDRFASDCD